MATGKRKKKRRQQSELFPEVPYAFEAEMLSRHTIVAGVDEVGRGCLAGPVVAAAVILPVDHGIEDIGDSKEIPRTKREELDVLIRARALSVAVGVGEVDEIDEINILQSSLRAMARALEALDPTPRVVLVDGREKIPGLALPQHAVIDGDARCRAIGAASIVAKVYRDALMARADETWPGYGFASHKGYASASHRAAIAKLGPCPLHRKSFSGVREYLEDNTPGGRS